MKEASAVARSSAKSDENGNALGMVFWGFERGDRGTPRDAGGLTKAWLEREFEWRC